MKSGFRLTTVSLLLVSGLASAQWATITAGGKCTGISMISDLEGFGTADAASLINPPRMLKTTDGSTWSDVTGAVMPSTLIRGLKFLNSTTGFLIGGSSTSDGTNVIFKTVNGGVTWTAKPIVVRTGASGYVWLTGISFANTRDGVVTGRRSATLGFVAVTGDGGETWTELAAPANSNIVGRAVMLSPTDIVVAGSVLVSTNNLMGVWNSHDRGVTWTLRHQPQLFSGTSTYPLSGAGGALYFFQGCQGSIANGGTCIAKSTDGGDTWATVGTQYLVGTFFDMTFSDAQHGIVVGKTEAPLAAGTLVMSTSNGGTTWTTETLPATTTLGCSDYPGPSAYAGPIGGAFSWVRNSGQGGGPRPALVDPSATGGGTGGGTTGGGTGGGTTGGGTGGGATGGGTGGGDTDAGTGGGTTGGGTGGGGSAPPVGCSAVEGAGGLALLLPLLSGLSRRRRRAA